MASPHETSLRDHDISRMQLQAGPIGVPHNDKNHDATQSEMLTRFLRETAAEQSCILCIPRSAEQASDSLNITRPRLVKGAGSFRTVTRSFSITQPASSSICDALSSQQNYPPGLKDNEPKAHATV